MRKRRDNEESWVPVLGYEGLYEVSDQGRVKSHDRFIRTGYGGGFTRRGRVLKPRINNRGYAAVGLCNDGKMRNRVIHRVVMESFEGIETPEGREVNHRDGNKLNNHLSNLEWVTRSENVAHAYKKHLIPRRDGEFNSNAVINAEIAEEIRAMKGTSKDIASKMGLSINIVTDVRSGRSWAKSKVHIAD